MNDAGERFRYGRFEMSEGESPTVLQFRDKDLLFGAVSRSGSSARLNQQEGSMALKWRTAFVYCQHGRYSGLHGTSTPGTDITSKRKSQSLMGRRKLTA